MDLLTLKGLCYSANSATSIAELHEKQMKITFIKEYLVSKHTEITTKGFPVVKIWDKYVRIGVHNYRAVNIVYDTIISKNSSLSGISVFAVNEDNEEEKIEIAVENLSMREITSIFVVLTMNL